MKVWLLAVLPVLLTVGCTTSTEIRSQDGWANYLVSCSGPTLNFGNCIEKAGDICRGRGYSVLDYEGGKLPDSANVMPQPSVIEAAIKGQISKADLKKIEIRKLYIRCN